MKHEDLGKTIVVITVIIIIHQLATSRMSPFYRGSPSGHFAECQSNLKDIGTALEMYSTDNAGHYPPSMALLTPKYMEKIPKCPSARRNTYSRSYSSSMGPDAYTYYCSGRNHRAIGNLEKNWPQYNFTEGLKTGFE